MLGGDAEVSAQSLVVHDGAVGLDISGLEEVALDDFVAASRSGIFDGVFDGIGLLSQFGDLGQQLAKVVDAGFVDDCIHGGLAFGGYLPCNNCLVSEDSLTPD